MTWRAIFTRPCREAEALSYFFAGEANRATASHILNKSSSRSHCIFTVYLESRASGDGADKTTGRGSPRHPPHRVPVLATPSTAWCTGARHAIHLVVYRCSPRLGLARCVTNVRGVASDSTVQDWKICGRTF